MRFDKLSHLSKFVHIGENSQILTVSNKKMFLMPYQVKKFSQRKLRDKNHQHFSTVSLPTDSVIVDHAVLLSDRMLAHDSDTKIKNSVYLFKSGHICTKWSHYMIFFIFLLSITNGISDCFNASQILHRTEGSSFLQIIRFF
jgi:hypothetical protein